MARVTKTSLLNKQVSKLSSFDFTSVSVEDLTNIKNSLSSIIETISSIISNETKYNQELEALKKKYNKQ